MIKILSILKKRKKYIIEFDNNDILECNEELIVANLLRKNKELSVEEFEKIKMDNEKYNYYEKALNYLKRGLKSKFKIYNYLLKYDCNEELAKAVVDMLEKKKLLDDYNYFLNVSNYYYRHLYGPYFIIKKGLEEKIEKKIIDDSLEKISYNEFKEKASLLVEKYYSSTKELDDKLKKDKCKRYLYQRGYSVDLIISLIERK